MVVMGVAGSGKTTVGKQLARRVGWEYLDADDLHSPENIAKMRRGQPLTDHDRQGWLTQLAHIVAQRVERRAPLVLACSALKRAYRLRLRAGRPEVQFVFLEGEFELLQQRLRQRRGHFMSAEMLAGQLGDLEPPTPAEALRLSITQPPEALVQQILTSFEPD